MRVPSWRLVVVRFVVRVPGVVWRVNGLGIESIG